VTPSHPFTVLRYMIYEAEAPPRLNGGWRYYLYSKLWQSCDTCLCSYHCMAYILRSA